MKRRKVPVNRIPVQKAALIVLVTLGILTGVRVIYSVWEIASPSQTPKNNPWYTSDTDYSAPRLVTSQNDAPYLIPKDEILQTLSEEDLLRIYWKYIHTIQILCKTQTRVGSLDDGGKEMCVDPSYLPSSPCIVYSFGSNFQFDFDLPMHDFFGCEVFTYDPSMNLTGKTLPHQLKFELRGLAGRDYINEFKWKMSTLETIMRDNGHLNKVIDVLKIDVEGAEWESVPAILEAGLGHQIKQLLIEVHAWRVGVSAKGDYYGGINVAGQLRVLRLLYEHGFRIFMRDIGDCGKLAIRAPPQTQITTINELSLVNAWFRRES